MFRDELTVLLSYFRLIPLLIIFILAGCGGGGSSTNSIPDNTPDDITTERKLDTKLKSWVTFGPYTLKDFDNSVMLSAIEVFHSRVRTSLYIDSSALDLSLIVTLNGKEYIDPENIEVFENDEIYVTFQVANVYDAISTAIIRLADKDIHFEAQTSTFTGELFVTNSGKEVILGGIDEDKKLHNLSSYYITPTVQGVNYDTKNQLIYAIAGNPCEIGDPLSCTGDASIQIFDHSYNIVDTLFKTYYATPPLKASSISGTDFLSVEFKNVLNEAITIDSIGIYFNTEFNYQADTNCASATIPSGESCIVLFLLDNPSDLADTALNLVIGNDEYIAKIDYDDEILRIWQPYLDGISTTAPICSQMPNILYSRRGACFFSSITINAEGTELYVTEEFMNTLLTFSVDADFNIEFVSETEMSTYALPGIALAEEGDAIYNGSVAYQIVTNGSIELRTEGSDSLDSEIVRDLNETPYLISNAGSINIELYDVSTDRFSPNLLASYSAPTPSMDYFTTANFMDDIFTGGEVSGVPTIRHLRTVKSDGDWSITQYASTTLEFFPDCSTECNDTYSYIRGIDSDADGEYILISGSGEMPTDSDLQGPDKQGIVILVESLPNGGLIEVDRLYLNDKTKNIIRLP